MCEGVVFEYCIMNFLMAKALDSDKTRCMFEFELAKKHCFYTIQDVFLLDTKDTLFVWIGKGSSDSERKNAMSYAHVCIYRFLSINYLEQVILFSACYKTS